MKVIKASGEEISFDPEKIIRSLERTGVSQEIIQKVLSELKNELYNKITTKEIYKQIFKNLKKFNKGTACKYHLKRGIMELGPAGFPFEEYIAKILEAEGYKTRTDQIMRGNCIDHEVDVIADKEDKRLIVECKFHSSGGNSCHVQTALYIFARFSDLANVNKLDTEKRSQEGWLVTNTKFSSDAEKYGKCVKLNMMSWDYPKGNSLREIIDKKNLYPITCLTTLSKHEKQTLLKHNIVLCQSISNQPTVLKLLGLTKKKRERVLHEAMLLSTK